mgnify:CR=1 FL=1|jgi:hypothetical protein
MANQERTESLCKRTTHVCTVIQGKGPSREILRDSLGSPELNRIPCLVWLFLQPDQSPHTAIPDVGVEFNIRIIVNGLTRPDGDDDYWKVTGRITEINNRTLRLKNEFEMEYRTDQRRGNLVIHLQS